MALRFMTKDLLIIFVKNLVLGKVKTRLAHALGKQVAFEIYRALLDLTRKATLDVKADVRIYYSDAIVEDGWPQVSKHIQKGNAIGERMMNAFKEGFETGYEQIILIGSDLPDMNLNLIEEGFKSLSEADCIFGPSADGGYYLVGLNRLHEFIFEDKPWSQPQLLEETLRELRSKNLKFKTLMTLNDIDTVEDLKTSNFFKSNFKLQAKLKAMS
ncbi:TIGR04282 family arsenosugar biosynthesis glycosyltransferase [Aestuariivivens sediminicola]|uniref:TIGR04282 family arsenosugar biosynthesis glycosyltransferase n=1 Tax=Aestuariivivens sediminicola TaxID=2913560 RepID=UPI001F58F0E2|nr:TIGR04282 family arsenosugar biosynthesis glycosyltransferase [Aestuariivivens sediminicola]